MKKSKFAHLNVLSLIFFTFIDVFGSHLYPVYSIDNTTETINTENTDFDCYKRYSGKEYPEAKSYCHALANTKIAESNKIWNNLTAITKDNKNIRWENNKPNSRLLVVTWTGWDGYEKQVKKDYIPTSQDTWVTVAPELQDFCKLFYPSTEITLAYRINQLLGLSPEDSQKIKKRKVVELWVKEKDLFRPTPDPEITDHEAEVDFRDFSLFMLISNEYKYWFLKQLMTNYYPWTKLGYTYDWGKHNDWKKIDPNRPVNVGLSEFIIRTNALVKIESTSPPENYCK